MRNAAYRASDGSLEMTETIITINTLVIDANVLNLNALRLALVLHSRVIALAPQAFVEFSAHEFPSEVRIMLQAGVLNGEKSVLNQLAINVSAPNRIVSLDW